jgi:hypothetical protein
LSSSSLPKLPYWLSATNQVAMTSSGVHGLGRNPMAAYSGGSACALVAAAIHAR